MKLNDEIEAKLKEFERTKSIPLAAEICYNILASEEEE